MNTLTKAGELQSRSPAEILSTIEDSYSSATRVFLRFLADTGRAIDAEGIRAFSAFLREEHDGERLAARTINFYLAAVKARMRYLLEHSQADEATRARVELTLPELKAEKVADAGVDAERCLTYEQIGRLVGYARERNPGWRSSWSFSPPLAAGSPRRCTRSTRTCGRRARDNTGSLSTASAARIAGSTFPRICIPGSALHFKGRKYLFAHGGERVYSREYVSMAICRYAQKVLGWEFSAHGLRHSFATTMLKKNPGDLIEISRYLRHAQASTTENIYLHGSYTAEAIARKRPTIPVTKVPMSETGATA
jgi:integrase